MAARPIPRDIAMVSRSAQRALTWLQRHGGDGAFDPVGPVGGTVVAAGVRKVFLSSTWAILERAGCVEFYRGKGGGRRVRMIAGVPRATA